MPLDLKFYNILEILICLLNFLNALNHSEYPSPTIVFFLAAKVVVLVSKFDDFELICSILQFHKGTDPVPFTARKEALILSAKKTLNLKPYLCAALLFHLCKNRNCCIKSWVYLRAGR